MPKQKLKTHKGAQKRFKVTGSGKLMRPKRMKSHFRRNRSKRVKHMLDKSLPVTGGTAKRILKRVLPYGV